MGQAKLRKAEIASLKAQPAKMTPVIALRHLVDGTFEMVSFEVQLSDRTLNSKNALLAHICDKDWLHTPPTDQIAEYLVQSNSYRTYKSLGDFGYVINFYEPGADTDAPAGCHSCRVIMGYPADRHAEMQAGYIEQMKADGRMSVKTYA